MSDNVWTLGEDRYHKGIIEVRFAGKIEEKTSCWSDPITLTATIISDIGDIGLINDFSTIYAGDEDELTWSTVGTVVKGFSLELTESPDELLIKEEFD